MTDVSKLSSELNSSSDDFDEHIVAAVDRSIWHGIRQGHFRLARKCRVCGRWLIAPAAKRAGVGRRCAGKGVL